MDNFGDYVDRPQTPPAVASKIFVSSTFDDFGGLRRLLQGLPSTLDVPVEIYNLGDERPPEEQVKARLSEADLVMLLLGHRIGNRAPGRGLSYIESDYDYAARHGAEVLIYDQLRSPGVDDDERMTRFRERLRSHHTVSVLDQLADVLQFEVIHDRLIKWLTESGRIQQTNALMALGDKLVVSFDHSWRDYRINHLDRWVLGLPAKREESGTGSLVERANDEWNEACAAFDLRAADLMRLHLDRLVKMRPLDAEARYWLGRLLMTTASNRAEWKSVLSHIEVATRMYESMDNQTAAAGLSHLVQAKSLRNLGELEPAQQQVGQAIDLLGWHSETHLEACYLELVAGNLSVAEDHLYDAFYKYPPSYAFAEDEVAELVGGTEIHQRVRYRLVDEVRHHLREMQRFEIVVGRTLLQADRRNESTRAAVAANTTPLTSTGENWLTRLKAGRAERTPIRKIGDIWYNPDRDQSVSVRAVGNNDGIVSVAEGDHDPVRLANLAQSLSTLNHTRLVELEGKVEVAYELHSQAKEHWQELARRTDEIRRFGLGTGVVCLLLVGFLGLIGALSFGLTTLVAVWTVAFTLLGAWWWNRTPLERAAAASERAHLQLKQSVDDFETLVGQYEKSHSALRYYLPRAAEPYGKERIWRLSPGSTVFTLVSNDCLAPHIRDAVGGLPKPPSSNVRLYRPPPGADRSAQADRWRAYASDAGAAVDRLGR
ncbi:MAG: DUF4062 domain-containing protein [Acidimicrobiia bacterium]|nr:DUF4062 domain-containing protein [Acidimicrobiia bacterium]